MARNDHQIDWLVGVHTRKDSACVVHRLRDCFAEAFSQRASVKERGAYGFLSCIRAGAILEANSTVLTKRTIGAQLRKQANVHGFGKRSDLMRRLTIVSAGMDMGCGEVSGSPVQVRGDGMALVYIQEPWAFILDD